MNEKKFDTKKFKKLNNPQRLIDIPPDYIENKLHIEKPEVIIEIGAGTAFFSIEFFRKYNPTSLYACDISDVMIDWMKENVSSEYPCIIPVKSYEHNVPLDDEISDLVFMINLHHELEDPALSLKESFRLLKSGGKIFIVDWKKKEMEEGPPVKIRYFSEEAQKQIEDVGFKNVEIFNDLQKHFLVVGEK